MTDDQIKAWIDGLKSGQVMQFSNGYWDISDCLTELLQFRELHRQIKWAVWVADQSAESGWTLKGAFPSEEEARSYRDGLWILKGIAKALVLPFREIPCLTAR